MSDQVDTFEQTTAASSGPFSGGYLWNNPANWNAGIVPANGDSVSNAAGGFNFDNIAGLTLGSLTQSEDASTLVVATSLDIGTVASTGFLVADAFEARAPVTVTVGTITEAEGDYNADGTGAVLVDNSAVDPGELYVADTGGLVELAATPAATSTLEYVGGPGTLALEHPGATNGATLDNLGAGDVLELPGTSVSNVGFGTNTLTVTTNDGSYAFTNVTYASGPMVNSFTAAPDTTTGLEAITFGVATTDTFRQTTAASSGPFSGGYLWSNPANWNTGIVPANGDSVSNAAGGFNFDNIAGLTLGSLTQSEDASTLVVASSLDIGTVTSTGFLVADAFEAGAPVTVTVGTITEAEGDYNADGTGAVLVDNSAVDPGELYVADTGGLVELAATPAATSTLEYAGGPGTLALEHPGATNGATLDNLGAGDVLELPGTSVSNVSFGISSLSVTTNDGTYDFTNVTYASGSTVNSFTAAPDTATGLEAITFGITETDTFRQTTAASSGPFSGGYLWNNPANWNAGIVPANGDSVSNAAGGFNFDNIAGLTLGTLTQSEDASTLVVASSLDIGTVTSTGFLVADAFEAGAPVTVTVGTITEAEGDYNADGTGAVLVDNSAVDPGELYVADTGGLVELAATPAATSTLEYVGGPGTLALEHPGATNGATLDNLGAGDVLELPGTSVSNVGFGTSSLSVTTNDGSYAFTNVTYASGPMVNSFTAAPDTTTGLEAITFAICFCKGSLIRTPSGNVPVEQLSIGDTVATWRGGAAAIRWIGRQTVSTRFGEPTRILPIRIKTGALGDHVPSRDLLVSPDHAILVGDVLVQAAALINNVSIVRETNVPSTFTYYHVELDDHSLIFAEDAPAETFIDNVDRLAFDNWEEYEALYPGGKPIVEMPYPRAKAYRQVPRVTRARLAERAAALYPLHVAAA